jgi:hypothetical protein
MAVAEGSNSRIISSRFGPSSSVGDVTPVTLPLGRIEGRSVAIEHRWGEGRGERYPEIVAEFIRLKVDLILTRGTEVALAAKHATSKIRATRRTVQ